MLIATLIIHLSIEHVLIQGYIFDFMSDDILPDSTWVLSLSKVKQKIAKSVRWFFNSLISEFSQYFH